MRGIRIRVGYRGAFLACIGVYDLFYGLYLAVGGPIEHEPLIPEQAWGIIWIACGLFLCIGAFIRHDAIFWAAAILIKMVWGLEFLRLDLFAHIPDDWIRCCYWMAFAAAIAVAAYWPEHIKLIQPPPLDQHPASGAEQRARDA